MLQATQVGVSTHGELVYLDIGNVSFSLHFPLALTVGLLLLEHGRQARTVAGVQGTHWRAAGSLVDLNVNPHAIPKARFAPKTPDELTEVAVRSEGPIVSMMFGGRVAKFDWNSALELSSWLRVRGCEARNFAGEKAPWDELAQLAR